MAFPSMSSLLPAGSLKRRNAWYALFVFVSFAVLLVAAAGSRRSHRGGAAGGEDEGAAGPVELFPLQQSQFWVYTGVLRADPERCYKNLVISSFSIMGMFRTLEMGAGGDTLEQMRAFFNEETDHLVPPVFEAPAVFQYAERVYVDRDQGDRRLAEYRERVAQVGGDVRYLDFSGPQEAVDDVNAFVHQRTEGLIREIVSVEDLDSLPNLLAVNAAILKAQWQDSFSELLEGTFYGITPQREHVEQSVTFMQTIFRVEEIQYTRMEGIGTIIRLPFTDKKLGMYIMMPERYDEVAGDLELIYHRLDTLVQASMNGSSDTPDTEVLVTMPKFTITPDSCKIDVISAMEAVGVTRLSAAANFSRLTDHWDHLQVDAWIHKAGIDADENGVVATAASAGSIAFMSGSVDEPIHFHVDHPFFFAVMYQPNIESENPSQDAVLLFNGHLVNAGAAQVGLD